ncbi:MAG: hypothetical protein C0506_10825, partial [Anaerolinea sp.]|nr:hypothetical protein [Anaerolinea sp.]
VAEHKVAGADELVVIAHKAEEVGAIKVEGAGSIGTAEHKVEGHGVSDMQVTHQRPVEAGHLMEEEGATGASVPAEPEIIPGPHRADVESSTLRRFEPAAEITDGTSNTALSLEVDALSEIDTDTGDTDLGDFDLDV